MFNIGTQEFLVILLVALLLFGAKRIPEIARALGKGLGEFRDALSGVERELKGEDQPARRTPFTLLPPPESLPREAPPGPTVSPAPAGEHGPGPEAGRTPEEEEGRTPAPRPGPDAGAGPSLAG